MKKGADLKENPITGMRPIRYKMSILTESLSVALCIDDHLGFGVGAGLSSILAACLSAEITFAFSSSFLTEGLFSGSSDFVLLPLFFDFFAEFGPDAGSLDVRAIVGFTDCPSSLVGFVFSGVLVS